jgi:hypothetical protein
MTRNFWFINVAPSSSSSSSSSSSEQSPQKSQKAVKQVALPAEEVKPTVKPLTEQEMNQLGAKIVKAELMGNEVFYLLY